MIKHTCIVTFALVFLSYCVSVRAQTTRPPAISVSVGTSDARQWEYLVVSFGKTLFADPIADPLQKVVGNSKLLAFSKAGIISAQEATSTQKQMDTLGRFGWELVGVVGEIGGDQELLFKRLYDPSRSRTEAKLIALEGQQIAAAEQAEEDAERKTPAPTELVDLDSIERQAAIDAHRKDEEKRLTDAINSLQGYKIVDVKTISTADSPTASAVSTTVTIDGTKELLQNGNQYRSSQADALAKKVADAIYDSAGLQLTASYSSRESDIYLGNVKISVIVDITLAGTSHDVAFASAGGKWPG